VAWREGVPPNGRSREGAVSPAAKPELLGHHALPYSLAHAHKCLLLRPQVLIKWCIQRGVPALPKTSQLERVGENFEGMLDWRLSNEHKVGGARGCECMRACVLCVGVGVGVD